MVLKVNGYPIKLQIFRKRLIFSILFLYKILKNFAPFKMLNKIIYFLTSVAHKVKKAP